MKNLKPIVLISIVVIAVFSISTYLIYQSKISSFNSECSDFKDEISNNLGIKNHTTKILQLECVNPDYVYTGESRKVYLKGEDSWGNIFELYYGKGACTAASGSNCADDLCFILHEMNGDDLYNISKNKFQSSGKFYGNETVFEDENNGIKKWTHYASGTTSTMPGSCTIQ